MKKPVERDLTIKISLKEAAGIFGMGYAWTRVNEYLDADSFDDVFHQGYYEKDVLGVSMHGLAEEVKWLFAGEVAVAMEDAERDSIASKLGEARRDSIKENLEKIWVTGEYLYNDEESVSIKSKAGVLKVDVDVEHASVSIVLRNPEHLLNDIVAGVGRWNLPFDPFVSADDDEIKNSFVSNAVSFFDVYGERIVLDEGRFEPDVKDKVFEEFLKERLLDLDVERVAEYVIHATDVGRFPRYVDAIKLACRHVSFEYEEIKKTVAEMVRKNRENHSKLMDERLDGLN